MGEQGRPSLPQRLVGSLPTGVRIGLAGVVGAGSLGLAACGPASPSQGGPVRGGEQVQPPVAVAPAHAQELSSPTAVPTEVKPTVAPTEPPPKPTAGPDILSPEQLLTQVDQLIALVQNPDKNLIEQYGLRTGSIEANTQSLLEGDKSPVGGMLPRKGLYDLKTAVVQQDAAEARKIVKDNVGRHILGRSFSIGASDNDLVHLTDEEIRQIDPDNNFLRIRLKSRSGGVSVIWRGLLVKLLTLYPAISKKL